MVFVLSYWWSDNPKSVTCEYFETRGEATAQALKLCEDERQRLQLTGESASFCVKVERFEFTGQIHAMTVTKDN